LLRFEAAARALSHLLAAYTAAPPQDTKNQSSIAAARQHVLLIL
jgi:hypothetical protein